MPQRAFRLEDLFNPVDPGTPPPDDGSGSGIPTPQPPEVLTEPLPEPRIPGGGYNDPLPPLDLPPEDLSGGIPPPPLPPPLPPPPLGGPMSGPDSLPIPAASPTSATAPGSFADPGSSAARPLQPFNYRSLFDSRNTTQGSLVPGSRVPTTPANIAPSPGDSFGGQSESAITRGLRRLRG